MAKNKVTKRKTVKKKVAKKKVVLKKKSTKRSKFPPAYFLSLSVENVRCFGPRQTIDLSDGNGRPSQWTVILGDNNTGKTTLLQSLVALEPSTFGDSKFLYPKLFHRENRYNLYRNKEKDRLFISGRSCFAAKITELAKEVSTEDIEVVLSSVVDRKLGYLGWDVSCKNYNQESLGGLVCYGYGASRIMGESLLSEKESDDSSASLFKDNVELINAEEWLLQADYAAKASKASSKIGQKARKRRDQIREVLINLLPEVDDIRVTKPTKKSLKTKVEFETPYGWITLDSLSLGYKAMITWMVDLANRMFERYPNSINPLAEPAVVLIDEIDLHLHPKWQRTIMNYLKDRFVNTQFIVTSHSPLVVQAAKNANIVLLKREDDHVVIDNDPLSILGWRVDQILTGLFELEGGRSDEIEDLQKKRRKILSKAKLTTTDKRKLKRIESKMGDLPVAETPEDIEAMDIIRQAAKSLNKKRSGKK
ncbi:MAG: AAA family ATPase [Planctomycetota bacterium]|jgi:predicted ATP-binding protein involved in virulence